MKQQLCVLAGFAWFSVPGKGESECSAVPKTLLVKKTNSWTQQGFLKQTIVELSSFPPPELSTCVLTACRQWALQQRLCSKPARGSCLLPWTKPAGERGAWWAATPPAAWGQRLECKGKEELSPARTGREGVTAEVRLTVDKIREQKSRLFFL